MQLSDDQINNQGVEPEIGRSAEPPASAAAPTLIMQQTADKILSRYKQLKSKIMKETEHTIKMSNNAVLRKTGVALRKITTPRKRAPGAPRAPPLTPQEGKRKMMNEKPSSSKSKRPITTSRKTEGDSSDDDNDLPLPTKRMLGQATTRAPGTSLPEDERTTTGNQEAEVNRPTAEPGERATISVKNNNAMKIRPSD